MDEDIDVDLPTVDGIPIPPYQPLSYGAPGPCTDKGMEQGLITAIVVGTAFAVLYLIALLLQH